MFRNSLIWCEATRFAALRSAFVIALALSISGCPAEEPPDQNEDGCDGPWFETILGETQDVGGDFTCSDGALNNPAIASAQQRDIALMGRSVDHESSDAYGNVSVDVFFDDDEDGTASLSFTTDGAGMAPVGQNVPACRPVSYVATRSSDDPAPAPPTLLQHKVWDIDENPLEYDFRSVSQRTIDIVTSPLAFNSPIEEGKGMLFGRAFDCTFESVVNAQVIVRDADCRIPVDALVGYTTNRVPDRNARATTEDGFFFGINIPAGEWIAEMYGQNDDDGFDLLGAAPITILENTVTLADIAFGRSDGLVVPDACLPE